MSRPENHCEPLPLLLLADDEEGIRTVLPVLLEDMGYRVITAASGAEALKLCKEQRPAIVLTDIKMPGMGGIDLLKAVKAHDAGAEVIMLTGHGDMDLAVASLRHGAGDFLNKPVSDAALEVALERAMERIRLRTALRRHTEELEDLVKERTQELVRSERFAAVGEAAACMAHSIKNVAGALEGTMYVLERGLELNKREYFEEGWRMVRSDVERLRSMAVNMLEMGRPSVLRRDKAVPGAVAQAVAELAGAKAQDAGISLVVADKAGPAPFVMAEDAVHQCLLNLVLNSIEALAGQGENTVKAKPVGKNAGRVEISAQRESLPNGRDSLVYCVSDNGPGLDAFVMDVQHDGPFGSNKEGGSGIGLYATRKAAHEMGAELRFISTPGQGTQAVLRLFESAEKDGLAAGGAGSGPGSGPGSEPGSEPESEVEG